MELHVLGPIEAVNGHVLALGGPRQRRILAALAMQAGEVVSVDRLADVTWSGEEQPAHAERNVRTYVHRLRGALGESLADRIATIPPGYALHLEQGELDSEQFERWVAQAEARTERAELSGALDAIDEALAVWRGRPYAEFADEEWARAEVTRLEEIRVGAIERRCELLLDLGRSSEALAGLEALIEEHPLRERPRGLHMLGLYRSGRQAESLRAFQEFRGKLIDEVGVSPSEDLVALDRAIAADDASLRHADPVQRVHGYEIHELIGEGAFAQVYRGTQPALGREVAIKAIKPELANRPEFIRAFEAEANMVARLEHPHIVPLHDFWREPDRAYLVMRWLSGGSLEAALDSGPWSLEQTALMIEQVGAALDAAHRGGVVHRDVKSANILLDADGNAYLGDFGIALEPAAIANPQAALSEGSPAYASPEQLRREPVGPAADVHGLAIAVYETLTGQLPFPDAGDKAVLLEKQLHESIPPVTRLRPELPADVDAVIGKATAKNPADRYPSVIEFVEAFTSALAGTPDVSPAVVEVARRVTEVAGQIDNPYKGLRAFGEGDAADFHGRERLVDELLARLRSEGTPGRVLAIVGASGSGKSSVVRAGALPALRRAGVPGSDEWFFTSMTPGSHPFDALETALLRVAVNPPSSLVDQLTHDRRGILRGIQRVLPTDDSVIALVVDQFEELFTLCDDEGARQRFLDGLALAVTEPGSPIRLILTFRADFYDHPLQYEGFAELLKHHGVTVTPLAADELEQAIVEPAHQVGVQFEPGLVAKIAADVSSQPGALPLMQYMLTQLFERRVSGMLLSSAYAELGGLSGALGSQADDLFEVADEAEQAATRRLFSRLVALGEGSEDTRRRVTRSELGSNPSTLAAIDRFGVARLLTFDRDPASREPTVEVAHEALIREWPRLRQWIDEDRDSLRVHWGITQAARQWAASGREEGDLFRGGRLETAEEFASDHEDELNAEEQAFIAAATQARDQERERRRRTTTRLRRLAAAVSVVAVLALVAGAVALVQQRSAADERDNAREAATDAEAARQQEAEQRALAEDSAEAARLAREDADKQRVAADRARADADLRRMASEASDQVATNRSLALLMAVETEAIGGRRTDFGALQEVFTGLPDRWLGWLIGRGGYTAARFLPDPQRVVARGAGGIDVFDATSRQLIRQIEVNGTRGLDVHSDTSQVAVGAEDGSWVVYDANAWTETARSSVGKAITEVHFSPDGAMLAIGMGSGEVAVQNLREGTTRTVQALEVSVVALALDEEGDRLLVGGGTTGVARQFDTSTGRQIGADMAVLWRTGLGSTAVAYVGGFPVVGNGDVQVFNKETGLPVGTAMLSGRGPFIFGSILPLNASTALVMNDEGEAILLDVETGEGETLFEDLQQGGSGFGHAISPDGSTILVPGGNQIGLWALDGSGLTKVSLPSNGNTVGLTEDGSIVASHSFNERDSSTSLWDVSGAPALVATLDGDWALAVGSEVLLHVADASGTGIGSFEVWAPGLSVPEPIAEGGIPSTATLSGDGRWLAVGTGLERTSTVFVFDRRTGELVARLEDVGSQLPATASLGQKFVVDTEFDPDSRVLVATNTLGFAAQWTTDTWELIEPVLGGPDGFWDIAYSGDLAVTVGPTGVALRDPVDLSVLVGPVEGPGLYASGQASSLSHGGGLVFVSGPGGTFIRDAETLELVGSSFPHDSDGQAAKFAADADRLATLVGDRVVVWDLDLDQWPDIACRAAGRNLTQAEWEQFGPQGEDYRVTCPQFPAGV